MPSTETKIWMALRYRVETLDLAYPIAFAWPAGTFAPGSEPYIAVNNIIAPPRRIIVGKGPHERTGTLTLVLVYPLTKGHAIEVMQDLAGQIAAQFPADAYMKFDGVDVRVVSSAHVQEGFRDAGWWRIPINISWQCFA